MDAAWKYEHPSKVSIAIKIVWSSDFHCFHAQEWTPYLCEKTLMPFHSVGQIEMEKEWMLLHIFFLIFLPTPYQTNCPSITFLTKNYKYINLEVSLARCGIWISPQKLNLCYNSLGEDQFPVSMIERARYSIEFQLEGAIVNWSSAYFV